MISTACRAPVRGRAFCGCNRGLVSFSFYSTFAGDRRGAGGDETSGANSGGSGDSGETPKASKATVEERRRMAKSWENAFFGRVHYEPGMHDRYQAALDAEVEEHATLDEKDMCDRLPNWPDDEETPLHEFLQLSDAAKKRYIVRRLTMGERRINYAPYYGSLLMMQHLNLGELMISDAEHLVRESGWMTECVASKIEAVRECASKIKFEYDLD